MGRILTTLSLAGLVTGLVALPASAQQSAGKVAYINSRLVLASMPEFAKAETLLTNEVAGYRLEVQKLQANLDSAVQSFQQVFCHEHDHLQKLNLLLIFVQYLHDVAYVWVLTEWLFL